MSVILFSKQEFSIVAGQYRSLHDGRDCFMPKPEDFDQALTVLHYANVMAYCLTYKDWVEEEMGHFEDMSKIGVTGHGIFAMPGAPEYKKHQRALVRQIRSMLYNTISNGGTECMPANYRQTLERAAESILEELAGMRAD